MSRKSKVKEEPSDGVGLASKNKQDEGSNQQQQPGYVVELAKSGRAMCKRCEEKIELKSLRVGVLLEGEWGLFTSWQHLACTIFHKSCDSVSKIGGYASLKQEHQDSILQRWQESQNEEDDDMTAVNADEIVRSAWKFPAEPHDDLLIPLLPYQKEGLGWMLNQEGVKVNGADESESARAITFGGILADEMGMGKTIQAISLMLTNRPSLKDPTTLKNWNALDADHEFSGNADQRGGTLLVLPTVAIRQWQTEISRFTREGSLTVKVYHGSDRSTAVEDLVTYDVVITSYKVLEMEYRKETAGVKVGCRICGKKFYPEKLRVHRKYFCGDTAQRTAAQSKTIKKRARPGSKPADELSSSDEDEEDEITKQKKVIKSGAEGVKVRSKNVKSALKKASSIDSDVDEIALQKEANKKRIQEQEEVQIKKSAVKKSAATPAKKRKTSTSKASSDISTSSEDEIARQKLENKKRLASQSQSKNNSKTKSTHKNAKSNTPDIEGLSTSSEDEIARQKLENKRRAAESDSKKELSSGKKRPLSTVNKKSAITESGSKRLRRNDGKISSQRFVEESDDEPLPLKPKKNINQVLSFDSSEEVSPIKSEGNSRTASASKGRTSAPQTRQNDRFDEETKLVEDIFQSPYRRPQRAAAIAAAQKSAKLLSANWNDDSDEEEEVESEASASESDRSMIVEDNHKNHIGPGRNAKRNSTRKSISEETESDEDGIGESASAKVSSAKKTNSVKSTPVTKVSAKKGTPSSASKVSTVSKKNAVSSGSGKKSKSKRNDDDDDFLYEEEEEDDDDDESADLDMSNSSSESDSIRNSSKKHSAISRSSSKAKSNRSVENDDDFDEVVEEDIRIAMTAHMKAMKKANAPKSLLHRISWFRIILDEAHMIKDRSTSTCKAVFNLVSLNKWCLTGTPLQNRVGELYSLIRFLRIDPHAYYYCRAQGCECKSLHYRFTNSKCDDCSHSVIQHFCYFNRHILNPIQRCGFVNEGRRAMLKLKHQILDNILLRRTKTTRADDIQLPMRIVQVRQERLDEKEEDFYQALYTQSQAQFNTYLMAGTVLNNYAHIFDILIKLRQAVDHPYLVIYSNSQSNNSAITAAAAAADEASRSRRAALTQSAEEDDRAPCCGLCQDPIEDPVKTVCDHWFCRACIMDYVGTVSSAALVNSSGLCCPDCNQSLTLFLADNNNADDQLSSNFTNSIWNESKRRRKGILDKIDLRNFQSSTKTEALMEELYRMEEEDVGSKAIVFSQFVNMLDILEYRIQIGGIGCVKLSGSMTVEQRDKTITAFKEDSTIRVLLISLKAGGVALNLTVASRIFLMDPWWNPAAEMQAIDRTHRIGQYKPIFATRFIIEDSIEERILKLQEKKKLVFDGTVGGDTGSMTKLTVDDMRFLFQ